MSGRRLSKQQESRIRARQDAQRQARSEATPDTADLPTFPGQVISHHGKSLLVEGEHGLTVPCTARQNLGPIVCGDRVLWQESDAQQGVIVAVEERRTLLQKPDARGRLRAVAANIDQIIVVVAPVPEISYHLIDRYFVSVRNTGLAAALLVNKIDLLDPETLTALKETLAVYAQIGFPTVYSSAKTEHGLDDLQAQLQGRTSILVGQSGVGKSSLVQALLPAQDIRVGDLSPAAQGKHTTTTSVLYHLPDGGDLVDSPGVRDFGLWHIDARDIIQGFPEFIPYLGQCRFHNCRHVQEPDCAVRKAMESGDIRRRRWESYCTILQEVEQGAR